VTTFIPLNQINKSKIAVKKYT